MFKQLFLIKRLKKYKYFKKTRFSPQSEPNTVKLCLSVVLKHLGGNSWRTILFKQKSD